MGLYDAAGRTFGGFFHTGDPDNPPPLHRNPWALFVLAGLLLVPLVQMSGLAQYRPPVPEVLVQLPEFSLIDQNGEAFTRDDLAGKVHIVAFFFTSCPSQCPRILSVMRGIQEDIERQEPFERYDGDLRLMAITVDPVTDTPEKLREAISTYGLDPARWTMLTGDKDAVTALVQGGFAMAVGEKQETAPGVYDIAHSNRLAVVDGDGGVRGFYGLEPASEDIGLTGAPMNTDHDGPDATRGWATVVLNDQRSRAR